jgi:hypothetical protein
VTSRSVASYVQAGLKESLIQGFLAILVGTTSRRKGRHPVLLDPALLIQPYSNRAGPKNVCLSIGNGALMERQGLASRIISVFR